MLLGHSEDMLTDRLPRGGQRDRVSSSHGAAGVSIREGQESRREAGAVAPHPTALQQSLHSVGALDVTEAGNRTDGGANLLFLHIPADPSAQREDPRVEEEGIFQFQQQEKASTLETQIL